MNTAVVYIAGGSSYCWDAEDSCKSIKMHNPDLPCIIASDVHLNFPPMFDDFVELSPRRYPQELWYLDSTRYCNEALDALGGKYDNLLFLDTDTYCDASLDDMLRLTERFDIALSHGVSRHTTGHITTAPLSFPEFEIGVMLVRTSNVITRLFRKWLELYENYPDVYKNNDQGPLREALWLTDDVKLYVLAEEYHARWGFGVCVVGRVHILHSRSPSYPNMVAAKDINSINEKGRRLFRPGGIL